MSFSQADFIRVENGKFMKGQQPYCFLGTNFWYGMNLGSKGAGGDRSRLLSELDQLQALGVKNLRIMAASEGPDDEPWRMLPSLQTSPGNYNAEVLDGLDFLLAEMAKRDMYGILCLNNFWPWSGGMAQYRGWIQKKAIPYPPPAQNGNWATYQTYTSEFYVMQEAKELFQAFIRFLLTRTNSLTGIPYTQDPHIMAWEIANEPRGILKPRKYRKWLKETAALIKSLDQNHLVTTGSEGFTPSKLAGTRPLKDHKSKHIDYLTVHIWIQNWGWYDPTDHLKTFEKAKKKALDYLQKHVAVAKQLNKPLVLEEFGISRDDDDHNPAATTHARDAYYAYMFEEVFKQAKSGSHLVGANFWAWGGQGRPRVPHAVWKAGDDFIGDPPHEYQGWYSVYDTDGTTLDIIADYARKMNSLNPSKNE